MARRFLPSDPKTIYLHKQQYELLKKRAEWKRTEADAINKIRQTKEEDGQTVATMADRAVDKRKKAGKLI